MLAAQELFETILNIESLSSLVGTPEHLRLECKEAPEGKLQRSTRESISKAVSGVCNADGGVVVLGMRAKRDLSTGTDIIQCKTPIPNVDDFHSRLLADLGQFLEPRVQLDTRLIYDDQDVRSGYVVIFVPPSEAEPHRAIDGRYYRRHGSTTLVMDHYEIAEMFGRRTRPELRLWWKHRTNSPVGLNPFRVDVFVGIENIGRGAAHYPALLLVDTPVSGFGLDGNGNLGLPERPTTNQGSHLFGGGADHVIYPGSILEVTTVRWESPASERSGERKIKFEIYADSIRAIRGEQTVEIDG